MNDLSERSIVPTSARWPVVLFDLDGTLADSIGLIIESYQYAFSAVNGREVSADEARTWIGQTLLETFRREDPPGAVELERVYRDYNEANSARITGYPGVPELLTQLNAAGVRPKVVTSKRFRMSVETVRLAGLSELVDLAVTMEDTERHKPYPDPLLRAFDKLGVTPEQCVYVGDAVWDVLAAHAAGIPAIAVTWGAGSRADLAAAAPEFSCDCAAELRQVLFST
ncbi:MAG: HAD-IA family hydrolase [Propionibacteriaceae bacterium]|nr:HAD-IA family hydrolase [Propionibacteriaceae bacterium]